MASTTALYTGLSGMLANARRLDVIGNNIANANTTAFKSNRMMFATQFSRTYNPGSAPSDNDGGSNPTQVGLGVTIAGEPFDHCYHQACDRLENVDRSALDRFTDATAGTIAHFAMSTTSLR